LEKRGGNQGQIFTLLGRPLFLAEAKIRPDEMMGHFAFWAL
jgi:hypothetical protein